MVSKREERIQNLAAGLLMAGRTPADALAQSAIFVQLCEARDAAEMEEAGATHDPGEDHELEAYIATVRELMPNADRYVIECWYKHNYTPAQAAEKWLAFLAFTEQQRKGVNP